MLHLTSGPVATITIMSEKMDRILQQQGWQAGLRELEHIMHTRGDGLRAVIGHILITFGGDGLCDASILAHVSPKPPRWGPFNTKHVTLRDRQAVLDGLLMLLTPKVGTVTFSFGGKRTASVWKEGDFLEVCGIGLDLIEQVES